MPTPTLSSSKDVFRVIAINRDYVMMQIFLFFETNLREKYD